MSVVSEQANDKRCPDCNVIKSRGAFYRNRSTKDGLQGYCKLCWDARVKGYNHSYAGRGYHRGHHLKKAYGITIDEYGALVARFDGRCWACREHETATHPRTGTVFNLAVDHDHATGRVRGVLCFKCNTTIRSVGDDRGRLLALVAYLDGP